MESLNKKKYDFFLYLLETGDAMVCLDARLPEVDVPKNQKNNPSLNLIFNLNFRRPFVVNEDSISATLAFNGRPHECLLPFESVWAIYDPNMKNGQVWEESIPADMNLADQVLSGITEQSGAKPVEKTAAKPAPKPEKKLKSLKTGGKQAVEGKPSAEGTPKPPRDRSHLRVIK